MISLGVGFVLGLIQLLVLFVLLYGMVVLIHALQKH